MQDHNIHNIDDLDLQAVTDEDLALEELPDGNALASWATAGSASTASCPGSSAATVGSASTFG
ncbi:thiocillin family RiPP [Yimella sp. cx-573]|nr:thiocillin family RiPP [Yimella sp. cx-573]